MPAFAGMTIAPALAQHHTAWHTGYLSCGNTQIRALAECYEDARFCVSETLTFVRGGRRTVVGLHKHYDNYGDISPIKVPVLSYTAHDWACFPGVSGGHYVYLVLSQTGGGNCNVCEFGQLYDLNGRLVASRVEFNERGRARENAAADATIRRLLGPSSAPRVFASIYKSR